MINPVWESLSVEFRDADVPSLSMKDQLICTQDPDDTSRVIPVLLITPSHIQHLRFDADGRMRASFRFTVKDAVLPSIHLSDIVRLLIYPKDPTRLVPMWIQRPGQMGINASCGLPWGWCHVVGPHHHTFRSKEFEEEFVATGHPNDMIGEFK